MKDLKQRIFSCPSVPAVFESGFEVYLVGGYLRDILRGANSTDIDFVFRGKMGKLHSWLSSKIDGKVVEFRKGPLLRVVTEKVILDFSELKGRLEDDLFTRDFTMNALAWSPEEGVIDPAKGLRDIEKGIIRAVSKSNLVNDPLRLLRAYRFAAELGWRIDSTSRDMVKELRALIELPAPERITLELFKILDSKNPVKALSHACLDGILESFIALNYNQLRGNIKVLSQFERFLEKIHDMYNLKLGEVFSQGSTLRGLLRAEILLFGADLEKSRLKMSRRTLKRIAASWEAMCLFADSPATNKAYLFDLFEKAGDSVMDFAILTQRKRILDEAIRFINSAPFLSAEEVMVQSGVKDGPEIGHLIRELRRLQFIGEIEGVAQAREWVTGRQGFSGV